MGSPDGILLVNETRAQELCALTRPGWKSQVRTGLIEEDPGGFYDERQVVEIALIGELRCHLSVRDTRAACLALKRAGRWQQMLDHACQLEETDRFDLVVEPRFCAVELAVDDAMLVRAVRDPAAPRLVLVIVAADRLRRVRDGFRTTAVPRDRPRERRVGRPPRTTADVIAIRRESS